MKKKLLVFMMLTRQSRNGHLISWHLHHQRQESGCEVRIMPQKY